MFADILILVLALIASFFAFEIGERSAEKLHRSWHLIFAAALILAMARVIDILTGLQLITPGKVIITVITILNVVSVASLAIAFWMIRMCIKEVTGELKTDGKLKIRKA